jgi:hypothetical protein
MGELQRNTRTLLSIFISYAHADRMFRAELDKHLSNLRRQQIISSWYDGDIAPGTEWQPQIMERLKSAQIILLLVSADFMASDFCYSIEMKQAIARQDTGEAYVIPILLRPTDWKGAPFAQLKMLPTDARAVTKWPTHDDAFEDVVQGIRVAIDELTKKRVNREPLAAPQIGSGTTSVGTTQVQIWMSERRTEHLSDRFVSDAGKTHDGSNGSYHAIQSVFHFNARLTEANEFYGRPRERRKLLDRTFNASATSIVGPRRIGKTWLMQYMKLVAATEIGSHFLIAYVDATLPRCATVAGFVSVALEELGIQNSHPSQSTLDLAYMEYIVRELKEQGYSPVLCIDEFEGLTNENTFDFRFFTGLRAIAQIGLVLVVASKRSLIDLVSSTLKTSPFFNIFEKLTLKPFSPREAEMFVNAKGNLAGFDTQERDHLLAYGQVGEKSWPPARLQLVGTLLLEEKTLAQQEDPDYYRPADPAYWRDFEKRLEEKYQEVGQ